MKTTKLIILIVLVPVLFLGCKTSTESEKVDSVYPMFVDNNENNINDYLEQATHDPGPPVSSAKSFQTAESRSGGEPGHAFTDANDDGICDYAQDGSPTWHGPGFIDENNNGICDYWDQSLPMHQQHEGMRFHDEDDNHINDYFEEQTHWGEGHDFVDEDKDGICDYAQDGSPSWHGPGYQDSNGNGVCDYWEEGGRGHGGMMGGHGHNG